MLLEILKIVLPFLSGGLAGALLNEWLRRRLSKVQPIPLIERVNRLVSPEMKGLTLARVSGSPQNRHLEEITNVREYQLTLRNTSTVHLQDVEIQFEFPTEDVEAWAERPALSKTAPVPVDAVITEPWKKGYRWRIPQLPATDSIDFTFRAVNPISNDYEVALYKSDRVVIEKSKSEQRVRTKVDIFSRGDIFSRVQAIATIFFLLIMVLSGIIAFMYRDSRTSTDFQEGGCSFIVTSSFDHFYPGGWPWEGPWRISHRVMNVGLNKCVVQPDQMLSSPTTVEPGQEFTIPAFSTSKPKLVQRSFSVGPDNPTHKTEVNVYMETK